MDHAKLLDVVVKHDKLLATKKFYNPHALAHYCAALQRLRQRVDLGMTTRDALLLSFTGPLLNKLLKAAGHGPYVKFEEHGIKDVLPVEVDEDEDE